MADFLGVLILDVDRFKTLVPIDDNVADKDIIMSLTTVQDTVLKPFLGASLYDKIIAGIQNENLSPAYMSMIIEKVWPVLARAALYKLYTISLYKISAQNIGKKKDGNTDFISTSELNALRIETQSELEIYKDILREYLNDNKSTFSEWEYSVDHSSFNFFYDPDWDIDDPI